MMLVPTRVTATRTTAAAPAPRRQHLCSITMSCVEFQPRHSIPIVFDLHRFPSHTCNGHFFIHAFASTSIRILLQLSIVSLYISTLVICPLYVILHFSPFEYPHFRCQPWHFLECETTDRWTITAQQDSKARSISFVSSSHFVFPPHLSLCCSSLLALEHRLIGAAHSLQVSAPFRSLSYVRVLAWPTR